MEIRTIVRRATASDAPAIATLARALASAVDDPEPNVDLERLAADLGGLPEWFECLVAEIRGEIVGFITYSRRFEAHAGRRELWVADFFVVPERRRAGLGDELFAAVRARAAALGCDGIAWDVWTENHAARRWYERRDARIDSAVYVMRLNISAPEDA